ncbi:palmitoyltransferase [Tulasnella sp. 418]|nr:palmitoyltransferase [Tulasnella sp. 418]
MKIYSMSVLRVPSSGQATTLSSASDLSSFSFYQRGSVAEFMTFFSKTVAERTQPGQRQSIQENNYIAHVYSKEGSGDRLSGEFGNCGECQQNQLMTINQGVIIADQEYPVRPAFSLLNRLLDEFAQAVQQWATTDPASVAFPAIHTYIQTYQDPRQADSIMKVQQELDETKIILHKTIESVLERGEKLDNLVDRSNALSAQSKMFYKTAKKQNSCCVIM